MGRGAGDDINDRGSGEPSRGGRSLSNVESVKSFHLSVSDMIRLVLRNSTLTTGQIYTGLYTHTHNRRKIMRNLKLCQ